MALDFPIYFRSRVINITVNNSKLFTRGRTPQLACRYDQRFSYCLYLPQTPYTTASRIVVAMHGSERSHQDYCDGFAQLAERSGAVVLAPLFPCGIGDPDDMDNYKYIRYHDIRFDLVLLRMVEEVRQRYGLQPAPLQLFGFSGGAHFAHRFLYLHPRTLEAVSICAPGHPTPLNLHAPCWLGVADLEQQYGQAVDPPAIRQVAIHLAVGELDNAELPPLSPRAAPGVPTLQHGAGQTRIERLQALSANYRSCGVDHQFELVPGAGHQRAPLQAAAARFFLRQRGLGDE
ncbi:alpha/beta hydrolase [Pseudoxanthomonas winnipegensis]|uniref:Alpha/beta hydrolase n=2 Tax=Pseudoxanthomonas winnipegensis TaxID=2480810 RepID=A0A4V2HEU9_9GAMM|nr:alpha/beta hydrolase [Pseudoxanthomonas winnipegensis]TAA32783.1 alpha/beta hydrolase [Pseudoxanthomonas winnipegensis]TAA34575.1 alpha/beta hydrolase [Pseudoxanthomonas winnipegensis]